MVQHRQVYQQGIVGLGLGTGGIGEANASEETDLIVEQRG
jgi:hypothetical protein